MNVRVRRHEGGGVAFSELRHDTTNSLHTHEQESDVQEQQILQQWRRFAREGDHQDDDEDRMSESESNCSEQLYELDGQKQEALMCKEHWKIHR